MKVEQNANGAVVKIRKRKGADMHQHARELGSPIFNLVLPLIAKRFAMALFMPNLATPITTVSQLLAYHKAIVERAPRLKALVTLYLTESFDPKEIEGAVSTLGENFAGIKYYPAGLTTNSDSGVKDPSLLWTPGTRPYECLRRLAGYGKVLLLHAADGVDFRGEELDPWDQEKHFVKETILRIINAHPDLKVSVEHLSSAWGVEFMRKYGPEREGLLGCSLTAHHLLLDRRDLFRGGFNPHRSWMPVIQPKEHKEELRRFAGENHSFVWLGSDSAPHTRKKKEASCCASGVMMAHAAIELYAEAFEKIGYDGFENFTSINGPRFYGLTPSDEKITLVREEWAVRKPFFATGTDPSSGDYEEFVPFRLGEKIQWKLVP